MPIAYLERGVTALRKVRDCLLRVDTSRSSPALKTKNVPLLHDTDVARFAGSLKASG
jgi:hypothetical protein